MKNAEKKATGLTGKLTVESLKELKRLGFRYAQVKGFTNDNRLDYIEPHYLMLFPFKELPGNSELKEIYERLDSKILMDWACSPDVGIAVRVAIV
jgi:hypothetical protein